MSTTHLVPAGSSAVTMCCGKTPLELPRTDRLTRTTERVTCDAYSRKHATTAQIEFAADLIHEQTCKDNQHDGPEASWPCVALAVDVARRFGLEVMV
ncbi:hypothetical protein RN607_00590 [Demequina capsici]|uniref:Uncharacterized protein n=1 Tax=Demequina capsici TaxID=3075620 RepID=A0AA96FFK4_9MICO|nr:hypothetical protein [Demequina sp. PMTSA13]WNM27530.1 hypothetical protein RN607_00590 [Demequina sp. PMTSA13]